MDRFDNRYVLSWAAWSAVEGDDYLARQPIAADAVAEQLGADGERLAELLRAEAERLAAKETFLGGGSGSAQAV